MKGGITSGVVYPAAVYEISKRFSFKNVGGTSAGAIAAVVTAAAEYRRQRGSGDGFERLKTIPDRLAQNNLLFRLFAPSSATASLYRTIVSLAGRPRFKPAFVSKMCSLAWAYRTASLLGAIPGIVLLVLLRLELLGSIIALFMVIVGIAIGDVIALTRDALAKIPNNYYGLVTGMATGPQADVALCTWLENELELIAGLSPREIPLTFGMLWSAQTEPAACGVAEAPHSKGRSVNLEMIATNLTYGRPYRWPTSTNGLYFRQDDMEAFFPPHVVDWLRNHPRQPADERSAQRHTAYARQGFYPVPPIGDLPVIVATRMSLAFPFLLSAVPMYAVDFSVPQTNPESVPPLEHVWFSDGGLSSNFPITLFDSPLPSWPTFAINLRPFPIFRRRSANEADNVYMATSNRAGLRPDWNRFTSVGGFVGAIVNAMQNWNDSTQLGVPGHRDRIVNVFLSEDEGGLNLDMPPALLCRLRDRGAAAGRMIAARFDDPIAELPQSDTPQMGWANHRWLRFRTTMGAIRTYFAALAAEHAHPLSDDPSFAELIARPQPSYPLPSASRQSVRDLLERTAALGRDLAAEETLAHELPKPPPELAIRATLDA